MKNLLRLCSVLFASALLFSACEGPMGPAGATGAAGKDGKDGVDANATCTQCHNNDAVIETRVAQWEESVHATGGNAAYANRTGCVQCHVSQGFLEAVAEGSTANITVPDEPQQINCYTCHMIHETYTLADWDLTKPGAQVLDVQYNGSSITYNLGNSNQCVQCHQTRPVSPAPVKDGADFAITSSRIGVHHGPNANLLLGKTAFELDGNTYPTSNAHASSTGCLVCHMAKPYGYQAGQHNMGMKYDSHGTEMLNTNGCMTTGCHSDATTLATNLTALQTAVTAKLDSLATMLESAGIYDPATGLAKNGTFNANAVMAYINFNMIEEDRSEGVHNPAYTKTLLRNSIQTLLDLGY
jgi:hypothetical protein